MVKISQIILPLFLAAGSASAFTPSSSVTFGVRSSPLRLSEEVEEAPAVAAPVTPPPAPAAEGGKMIAIKDESVEFTAGVIGAVAGFVLGGPVIGAVGAAAANYVSKQETEVSEVVSAVSKSSLEVYNYLVKLDDKYELLNKTKGSLETALDKLKAGDNVDPDTVAKVENALAQTTSKINEINEEYDLVGAGMTALGVAGDLVEKAIVKANELNAEYKLTDKALEALSKAVDTAKSKVA